MSDWKLTKRVARFLKEINNLKLKMIVLRNEGNKINLASWSDSDYAADKVDRNSVTGGVLTMDGAIVQWVCKKQTGVSLSTMKAEFASASHAGRELIGLRELMREIGF